MDYIELTCRIDSDQLQLAREILTEELANIGFESFVDTDSGLLAYIANRDFDSNSLNNIAVLQNMNLGLVNFKWDLVKDQNWNQEWENNFSPVLIDNRCYIRATFHRPIPNVKYEIVIEPKMSFGTGHHETTSLMVEQMLDLTISNKKLLDMGCGTGILAILASKLGATEILAIDIDEWAYRNALENIDTNNCPNIKVVQGDKTAIPPHMSFDIILANINRNILLSDMETYCQHITSNGHLLLSGIYQIDLEIINNLAIKLGLEKINVTNKNNWISVLYHKL